jgi:outer membrane biosynthesis protein TonB
MSARDDESSNKLWLVIFVLLSVLVHIVTILAIILISIHMPVPKIELPPQASPEVTLSLLPPPPAIQPPKRSVFLSTTPDPTAQPHQNTPIESDNTTALKSQAKAARAPDSVLPDVTATQKHSLDLQDAPYIPPTPNPQTASNQSARKQSQQSPPQPQQQMTQQQTPKPTPPAPKPPEPSLTKTTSQQVVKNNVNPNGLPVLPPIDAPTLAPQTPVNPMQQVQNQTAARPPPSFQLNKSDVAGSQGAFGNNSPAANASELGRYKAKFYRAVGSRWYAKVAQSFQILPVGTVHIQYTIHSDGIVDNIKVLEGTNGTLQLLLSISQNSITEASPFDPVTDSLRKEVARNQGNDGESYTDDFTFSIYGG